MVDKDWKILKYDYIDKAEYHDKTIKMTDKPIAKSLVRYGHRYRYHSTHYQPKNTLGEIRLLENKEYKVYLIEEQFPWYTIGRMPKRRYTIYKWRPAK